MCATTIREVWRITAPRLQYARRALYFSVMLVCCHAKGGGSTTETAMEAREPAGGPGARLTYRAANSHAFTVRHTQLTFSTRSHASHQFSHAQKNREAKRTTDRLDRAGYIMI